MEFVIRRTSVRENEKPCKEAYEKLVPNWHERACSEEYYNKNFAHSEGGEWKSKGTDHLCNKTYIRRREGEKQVWCVEIKTLEDLIMFSRKYGDLVLNTERIEIYDDYRE